MPNIEENNNQENLNPEDSLETSQSEESTVDENSNHKKNKKSTIIKIILAVVILCIVGFIIYRYIDYQNCERLPEYVIHDNDIVCYKPVIYLYPETTQQVEVKMTLDGEFTCTYPKYNNGWKVEAQPDGTLTDQSGQTYNYLYWEGTSGFEPNFETGFCVKGEDTAQFLESTLDKLGISRKEANEFIVYWLPLLEQNKYNLISFQGEEYNNSAKLEINPTPDTIIRVFMSYKPLDEYIEIQPQELNTPDRNGFIVVEWGGTQVN